ncbi:MAG TPA: 3-deoxy-8-phosphooctulonate synthase [Candidatus Methylacidiphilales bacterium]|nr:3-deoxy-8-phosphooctulonate synthase [Candidatus Methylacidiphilales bacterium]
MASAPFFLIAGPCVLESEELTFRIARELKSITDSLSIPLIFKASFDKANRSSVKSFRGPGLEEGLAILAKVKAELGCPVITDIHETIQVPAAAEVIDVLQIPAFLCRQTDLLVAAAKSGRTVNVKKGQFLSPQEVNNIAVKLKEAGCEDYYITERGTTFGYNNLVVDMRGLAQMRADGHRVIFDATHSVQRPGGQGTTTGGDRTMVPVLARAAVAVGIDGLFLETHPNPDQSPSDGPNMIPLNEMHALLTRLVAIHTVSRE